jgi:hypothetical protein
MSGQARSEALWGWVTLSDPGAWTAGAISVALPDPVGKGVDGAGDAVAYGDGAGAARPRDWRGWWRAEPHGEARWTPSLRS